MPHESLLDREFLERLERLTIHWQRSFAGLVGGHNRSRFAGGGQEFLDHRQFHDGDDLRAVNWRAYMRLDKMFLKMFQIEPRVPVRLLLDTSASMAAGSGEKFLFAKRLAAALAYVGLVRLDTIQLLPFSDSLREGKSSGGGRHRYRAAEEFLDGLKPEGVTDFFTIVRQYLNEYPQRGLVIVLSDFLDDASPEKSCERAIQYLADYGNELMLVQLWADEDRTPPWSGEVDFVDAESASHLRIQVDDESRRFYTEAFDAFSAVIKDVALRNNGKYAGIPTSTPLDEAIFGTLVRVRSIA
ncbi:MAG TPA: DUF58 domain-containing protein [Bryobacteraceae bacterium]|nr:DUF58 domain-containing protein [Bryobacteraceae bacterium]